MQLCTCTFQIKRVCEISEDTKDENTLSLYRQYRKCPWMTKNKTDTVPFGCWTWHLLFHVVLKSKMRHYFWKLMWVFKEIKTILFCFYLVFMYYDSLSSAFLSSSISLLTFSKDFFFFFLNFISSLSFQLFLDLLYFTLTSVVSLNYKRAYIMTMRHRDKQWHHHSTRLLQ